ncbi:MAG: replication restart helicase PriA [Brevinema sp.]
MLAEVAINVPLYSTFHYRVPEAFHETPLEFRRIEVPFGRRKEIGLVLRLINEEEIKDQLEGITLKEFHALLDEDAIFTPTLLSLARRTADYYFTPVGEMIFSMLPTLTKKLKPYQNPHPESYQLFEPNEEQQEAFDIMKEFVGTQKSFLLQGVTGSGKTEVYKMLAREALAQGKDIIIMVPEIALTDQTLRRFTEEFGSQTALFHSRLKPEERAAEWMRVIKGEAKLVVGPRSAIFAPFSNLGLIIMDEEHDPSYKAGSTPRYHARGAAFLRSAAEKALLVFGSATPSLETRYAASTGTIGHIRLFNRYGSKPLPKVEIVDLTKEKSGNNLISPQLLKGLMSGLAEHSQSLIFLNRRGYAPSLLCQDCGYFFKCPHCDVGMTYHKSQASVRCRYCGFEDRAPSTCPECGSLDIKEIGHGTEKLEESLLELLPSARILRLDLDTARKKMGTENILRAMHQGEADILVGTQIIAKGHDLAKVTLVGALLPDIMLSLPDFRASERTFSLLTQAAGRSGRRDKVGKAIIQTYLPNHEAILSAAKHDYEEFYKKEILIRKEFGYPPFTRMGRVVFRSTDLTILKPFIEKLRSALSRHKETRTSRGLELLGPSLCPIEKINNYTRYHILLKAASHHVILQEVKALKRYFNSQKVKEKIKMEIDIDPTQIL